jgi:hypothetical protein
MFNVRFNFNVKKYVECSACSMSDLSSMSKVRMLNVLFNFNVESMIYINIGGDMTPYLWTCLMPSNLNFHVFMFICSLICCFFDYWYIIKHLFTETLGKQCVLWTLNRRCFPRLRLGRVSGPQNTLFPSVSVNKW